mmetsp:Transcript_33341/g.114714  ORF Transcript_33341/g.114714 Transcript_33341/m.114714 type:complete len:131 (-) Transcript_33341:1375-1767(-)
MSRQVVIASTARTGLAKSFRGGFNNTHGVAILGHTIQHAMQRAGVDPVPRRASRPRPTIPTWSVLLWRLETFPQEARCIPKGASLQKSFVISGGALRFRFAPLPVRAFRTFLGARLRWTMSSRAARTRWA